MTNSGSFFFNSLKCCPLLIKSSKRYLNIFLKYGERTAKLEHGFHVTFLIFMYIYIIFRWALLRIIILQCNFDGLAN